jgi:putative iron-regulated protein
MLASASKAAVAVALFVSLATGCSRTEPQDSRQPVLETYAQIVLATYEDTIATARELDTAIDALLANPSEETLSIARDRWRAARIPYSYSEAFRFYAGPIDSESGPEGQLNGWPLDENHIDAVAADKYNAAPGLNIIGDPKAFPQITPELISKQNEAGGEKISPAAITPSNSCCGARTGTIPPMRRASDRTPTSSLRAIPPPTSTRAVGNI